MCDYEPELEPKKDQTAWDGEGLPPVGTVCEIRTSTEDWWEATVRLYDEGEVIWRPKGETLYSDNVKDVEFRPIKTDRDRQIEKMVEVIRAYEGITDEGLAEALYEAGARIEEV